MPGLWSIQSKRSFRWASLPSSHRLVESLSNGALRRASRARSGGCLLFTFASLTRVQCLSRRSNVRARAPACGSGFQIGSSAGVPPDDVRGHRVPTRQSPKHSSRACGYTTLSEKCLRGITANPAWTLRSRRHGRRSAQRDGWLRHRARRTPTEIRHEIPDRLD